MKGLILSGGKGTRLRPLTFTRAKQLVPVANKPVLFYGLEALADAGIEEIGIVTGDTGEEIRLAVGDGAQWGVKVTYIPQSAPLGLAHAVMTAEPFLGKDDFVMYLGDNLIFEGVKGLVEEFQSNNANAQVLLAAVPNPQQFGVAELEEGQVVRLVEKPKEPKSNLALVGVYLFDSNIFEAVHAIKPSPRGELEITDAIQYLIDHNYKVQPHFVSGWWKDTGKLEDLLEANRLVLDTIERRIDGSIDAESLIEFKVVVQEGAYIEKSHIRGPAIIGKGARIVNSYIGPFTAIHHQVEVLNSEVEHSIILEDSKILNLDTRLEDSLIGRNVTISKSHRKPLALRFMVGDNSEIGIL